MHLDERTQHQIDQIFASWDAADSPGAALAVLQDGELVYAKGYGLANLEYGLPITPTTVFHVASVSKQFTAMAVMLLVQGGLVSLHADIHTYLPELPDFGQTITLWHLLHHTSGLRDQWELLVAAGWRMDDVITKEQIMKLVQRQRGLNFHPGAEYLYSNTGFTLAAEIVARVSGQSFRDFCAERIFGPLGMERTHFHDDHEEIVPGRAYSYAPKAGGGWRKSVLNYANVGATSLFTTVIDLAKWLNNFDQAIVAGGEVLRQMETPFMLRSGHPTEYGLGLMLGEYHGQTEIGHSGADAGFRAWCGRFPKHGLGLVVLCNFACAIPRDLARQVAEIMLPNLREPAAIVSAPDPQDLQGEYFLLTDGSPLVIKRVGAELRISWQGKDALLYPLDRQTWNCPDLDLRVVGQRDEAGKVSGLALQSPRMNIGARRSPGYQVAAVELAQYTGCYYCEELATTYQIIAKDGGLLLTHRRHSDSPLVPAGPDAFVGGNARVGSVRFQRDGKGHLSGMLWSGNRVRDLWFERQV